MKKADVVLGVSVIAAGMLLFSVRSFLQKDGAFVRVEKDGEFYGSYSMSEDQEIAIDEQNRIQIRDQSVWMSFSTCPDHLCEHQGTIRSNGEMIVCLPNRVIVQVYAKEDERPTDVPDVIAN